MTDAGQLPDSDARAVMRSLTREIECYTDCFSGYEVCLTDDGCMPVYVDLIQKAMPCVFSMDGWSPGKVKEEALRVWRSFIVEFDVKCFQSRKYLATIFNLEDLRSETREAVRLFPIFPQDQQFTSNLIIAIIDKIKEFAWHFEQYRDLEKICKVKITDIAPKKNDGNARIENYFSFENRYDFTTSNHDSSGIYDNIRSHMLESETTKFEPIIKDNVVDRHQGWRLDTRANLFGDSSHKKIVSPLKEIIQKTEFGLELKVRLNLILKKAQKKWKNLEFDTFDYLRKLVAFSEIKNKKNIDEFPGRNVLETDSKMGVTFGIDAIKNRRIDIGRANKEVPRYLKKNREFSPFANALKHRQKYKELLGRKSKKFTPKSIKPTSQSTSRLSTPKHSKSPTHKVATRPIRTLARTRVNKSYITPSKSSIHDISAHKKAKYENVLMAEYDRSASRSASRHRIPCLRIDRHVQRNACLPNKAKKVTKIPFHF